MRAGWAPGPRKCRTTLSCHCTGWLGDLVQVTQPRKPQSAPLRHGLNQHLQITAKINQVTCRKLPRLGEDLRTHNPVIDCQCHYCFLFVRLSTRIWGCLGTWAPFLSPEQKGPGPEGSSWKGYSPQHPLEPLRQCSRKGREAQGHCPLGSAGTASWCRMG